MHRRPGTSYYDRHLPGAGLLIWKIDPASPGQWRPGSEGKARKLVDLVCADGLYEDAGYGIGVVPDPFSGRDNLDFWAHDAHYRAAHGGNLGDGADWHR